MRVTAGSNTHKLSTFARYSSPGGAPAPLHPLGYPYVITIIIIIVIHNNDTATVSHEMLYET